MAEDTVPEGASQAGLSPDEGASIPRIRFSEVGFSALKVRNGRIFEESNTAFQFPALLKVVAEMQGSPEVSIGLNAINTLMNRAEVYIEPVVGETAEDKSRREYLHSVLHDMEDSWQATAQQINTNISYGYQISEMVFRRRLPQNGSMYNDGLVGLKALKNRPQNSIAKFNFDDSGRNLVSVSQSLANLENSYRFQNLKDEDGFITIPREKFILFRCDPVSDNPQGTSILKSAYLSYKRLELLTDHMMTGVSKDTAGIPFAQLPPKYMDPKASEADKAVYAATQAILTQVAEGVSKGIVFPKMSDDAGNDLFSFSLLEQKSGKAYDLPTIIKMLQSTILSVLSCDSIKLGDAGGSLSLQDGDTNLLALRVSYLLSQTANTLNKELVPLLWRMNGWATDRLPKIKFKDVSSVSLEEFSKFLQRVMSVGGLEMDRGVMNKIREVGGFELKPEDAEIDKDNLSTTLAGKASSSGEGMAVGVTGDGTSKSPGGKDNSTQNSENKG